MAATKALVPIKADLEESEEDKELQVELNTLVDRICAENAKTIIPTIEMLKMLIRNYTTSMTSVPKPIKYLAPHFFNLKDRHSKMDEGQAKKKLADVVSILAMGRITVDGLSKDMDCLEFCLKGTMKNIAEWGHDYMRQLEHEIVLEWYTNDANPKKLLPLVKQIIAFDFNNHDEIQGCDLLMEIGQIQLLFDYVTVDTYEQICLYLTSCTKYLDETENNLMKNLVYELYVKFGQNAKALIIALHLDDEKKLEQLFKVDNDMTARQLAFICARHFQKTPANITDEETLNIFNNVHLSPLFLGFVRSLDILEPKTPEDIYKIWLESYPHHILSEKLDSAKQNLASSFVNGFINCGFGTDKLLTGDNGNTWIFRNKDLAMMSATAALGLIFLWDVDGGLTPIDKFLYSTETKVKAGALLAMGLVNCRVRNECDPALALLGDYVNNTKEEIQIGAILGIGLAYAGSGRDDVLSMLQKIIEKSKYVKILGIASLACGLISLGRTTNKNTAQAVLQRIMEGNGHEVMKSPFMFLAAFGVALCYFNCRDIAVPLTIVETLMEPFRGMFQILLKMCAFVGSGDVLIIQELLRIIDEKVEIPKDNEKDKKEKDKEKDKEKEKDKPTKAQTTTPTKKYEWDYYLGKAVAVIACAAIASGEELGNEMIQRTLGQISCYGEPTVRKAVPLALALTSISNPNPNIINILSKYSHDADSDVVCNAIFGLGYIGAGTNHARLAQNLRHLAQFHNKSPNNLFMVRIAQGLVHLGKGTLTLDPCHQNRQLIDPLAMAGVLVPLVALIKPQALILGRNHYLLYTLAMAIQPRWLLTVNETLNPVNCTVRVGQAVDVVGKAGVPKTIAGIRTHNTPVLLNCNERAEIVGAFGKVPAANLEGICVVKGCKTNGD